MRRVASLFLPQLAVERLRRLERPSISRPEPLIRVELPVDDDPGACSVPRGASWRPGARWARDGARSRDAVAVEVAALPRHQQPSIRELGRRSEAAPHPFRAPTDHELVAPDLGADSNSLTGRPLALIDTIGRKHAVVAACPAALTAGVNVGMAATHARALVPDLDVRPTDLQADQRLLERLALRAVRSWTPIASVTANDGLWLDLTGVTHLFGGEEQLSHRVVAFCRRAGFTARMAVADTAGAAYAVARFGPEPVTVVPPERTAEAVLPLPVAALRLSADALTAARRFGFERVADLVPVARGPLARRLGLSTVERLDQALGRLSEPLIPLVDEEVPAAERRLLEPIGTADQIRQVMSDLLSDLRRRRAWT